MKIYMKKYGTLKKWTHYIVCLFLFLALNIYITYLCFRFLQSPNKIQKGQRGAKPQYKLPMEYRDKLEPVPVKEPNTSGRTIKSESDDTFEGSNSIHEQFEEHEDHVDSASLDGHNEEDEDSACEVDDIVDEGFACRSASPAALTESCIENDNLKPTRPDSMPSSCGRSALEMSIPSDRMPMQEIESSGNSHLDHNPLSTKFLAPPLSHHLSMSDLGPYPRRGYRARSTDTQHPHSPTFTHSPFLSCVALSPPYYDVTDAHAVQQYRVLDSSCPRSRSCDFAQSVQVPNYPFRPVQPRSVSPRLVVQNEPEDLSIRSRSNSSASSATSRETRLSVTDTDVAKSGSPT